MVARLVGSLIWAYIVDILSFSLGSPLDNGLGRVGGGLPPYDLKVRSVYAHILYFMDT